MHKVCILELDEERWMRGLLCHCRRHLKAEDDVALLEVVRAHLIREHPALPATDEQVEEIVVTRAYEMRYPAFSMDEEYVLEPY